MLRYVCCRAACTAACAVASRPHARRNRRAIHPAIQAAVDSQERLPKDRARDANRHYAEILEFFGVRPGMTVIELFAAGGNTAEVLARAVGPNGKVYMQNPDVVLRARRTARPSTSGSRTTACRTSCASTSRSTSWASQPNSLDGAVAFMVLHDFFWLSQDVPDVLTDVHKALKPGGWFGVVDHSAPAGTGAEHAKDRDKGTHRIDEAYVKKIFADAGFVLEASNDVLRNPADDRTKPFYDESFRGKSTDRFVLRFRKKAP